MISYFSVTNRSVRGIDLGLSRKETSVDLLIELFSAAINLFRRVLEI